MLNDAGHIIPPKPQLDRITQTHRYEVLRDIIFDPLSFAGKISLLDLALADFVDTLELERILRLDYLIQGHLTHETDPSDHLGVLVAAETEVRVLLGYDLTMLYHLDFPLTKARGKILKNAFMRLHILAEGPSPIERYGLEICRGVAQNVVQQFPDQG
jgi:hypothetical protein